MAHSLETRFGEHGIEYHHEQIGHIATKIFANQLCSLVPVEGLPKQVASRIFGNPYAACGIGHETADWMALALVAELLDVENAAQKMEA